MYTQYESRRFSYDAYFTENLQFFAHIHPHLELIQVLEGTLDISIGPSQALLQPGDVAVVFPNTVHSYRSSGENRSFLLIFHPDLVGEYKRLFSASQPSLPFLTASRQHGDIPHILARLQEAVTAPVDKGLRKGYLLVLLGRLLEQLPLEDAPARQNIDLIHRLLTYLDSHFQEPLSLGKVAAELHISKYHLSRCFSQRIGVSFHTYVNTLRARYARSLLAEGGRSITEACFEAGFESVNTFYRAFQACYGLSPGRYQKSPEGVEE